MDKEYWEKYYQTHKDASAPSLFAKFVWREILCARDLGDLDSLDSQNARSLSESSDLDSQNSRDSKVSDDLANLRALDSLDSRNLREIHILELGCGNGRDSFYFAQNGARVTAIDQASKEIAYLQTRATRESLDSNNQKDSNPRFIAGDFTQLSRFNFEKFDCIYSRFTLHSIDKTRQDALLAECFALLKPNGFLCIEARGEKNALFGKGEAVKGEPNAFIHDSHYRRFLNLNDTLEYLSSLNFTAFNPIGGGRAMNLATSTFYTARKTKDSLRLKTRTTFSSESSRKKYNFNFLNAPISRISRLNLESSIKSNIVRHQIRSAI